MINSTLVDLNQIQLNALYDRIFEHACGVKDQTDDDVLEDLFGDSLNLLEDFPELSEWKENRDKKTDESGWKEII